MKTIFNKLLLLLFALVLCVGGFGFYRGWFALSSSSPEATSHKVNINLTVDPDKMHTDAETVKEKTKELTGKAADEAKKLSDPAKENK